MNSQPRSGYTLPVFACAAAIAALRHLHHDSCSCVSVDLIEPAETVDVTIEQVACLGPNSALAITRSDPGDNLDLTRNTPVWALVEQITPPTPNPQPPILLKGGEGIGKQVHQDQQPAIYAYARRLLEQNLQRWRRSMEQIQVTIILPEGKRLAERTSNAAFGVVEGLSLLGTSGIAQPLSAPGQLALYQQELRQRQDWYDGLVFCIGENGLDLAKQLGIESDRLIKTANWLGSMLVEAGLQGVRSIVLFGYHGKLIKLAGGIFHTHHHVADARQEILAAHCANLGLPTTEVQAVFQSATAEAALQHLRQLDVTGGSDWVELIYGSIAQEIDRRAKAYIQTHSERSVQVGCVLFDRQRQRITQSKTAAAIFPQICQYSYNIQNF
ncbi:cobalt-precorrin-5B (C(1))-methyltransferase CbiD [Thermocoleostomius sinensis]|uniref:cobalt-precorrin-5B (C(1))-methyltransferase CbiD n=1 Tax=Thermocoleostomius sinensis TaxID=3065396 RepID=UPI0036F39276